MFCISAQSVDGFNGIGELSINSFVQIYFFSPLEQLAFIQQMFYRKSDFVLSAGVGSEHVVGCGTFVTFSLSVL